MRIFIIKNITPVLNSNKLFTPSIKYITKENKGYIYTYKVTKRIDFLGNEYIQSKIVAIDNKNTIKFE